MEKLDGQKLRKLVFGALGILTCYWTTSVVHEHLYNLIHSGSRAAISILKPA